MSAVPSPPGGFLFATEKELFPNDKPRDISNEEFWNGLHRSFDLTMDLVQDLVRDQEIDVTAVDLGEEKTKLESEREKAEESPLVRAVSTYSSMATEWMQVDLAWDEQRQNGPLQELMLRVENAESMAAEIHDPVEVIQWYQPLIQVKLMRALEGEQRELELENDEELDDYPSDSDGSAKVALIAIDHSIGAWGKLHSHFADRGDNIVDILIYLSRLRVSVENHFTRSRSFVRPGFDQEA